MKIPVAQDYSHVLVTDALASYQAHRLVITGTRRGRTDVFFVLDEYVRLFGVPWLVLGGDIRKGEYSAQGVDAQAREWARLRGVHGLVVYAYWDRLRRRAGPERNSRMVGHGRPGRDRLLAFPDAESVGTHGCYAAGKSYGLFCAYAEPGWQNQFPQVNSCA